MVAFNTMQSFVTDYVLRCHLYDWGKLITPFIFITWLFFELKSDQIFKKSVALFFMLDQWKEVFDMITTGNANDDIGLLWQNGFLLFSIMFCLYKANDWNYENLKSEEFKEGVYMLVLPPKNVFHFYCSLLGIGAGTIMLFVKIDERILGFKMKKGSLQRVDHLVSGKLIRLPVKEVRSFLENINVGQKFKFIKSNCITVYSIALKQAGIKINFWKLEFIPQICIKKLLHGNRK